MSSIYFVIGGFCWEKDKCFETAFERWAMRALTGAETYVTVFELEHEDEQLLEKAYIDQSGGLWYPEGITHKKVEYTVGQNLSESIMDKREALYDDVALAQAKAEEVIYS